MAYEQAVLRAAKERLANRRRQREERAEAKRREIYAALPRVAEIDRTLRRTMTELMTAALRGGNDPAPAIAALREKNMDLQVERAELLTTHGYRPDDPEGTPYCALCGDSGWVRGVMCSCLKELCAQAQIKELSRLLDLGEQSFDTFDMEYYSPLPWAGSGIAPRENMEMVFEICGDYARKFGRYYFNNLFLTGAPGLGKTFLSACIARTVSENGFSVVYDTAVNIFAQFEAQKFGKDLDDTREARDETRRYLYCDLLILDDLGSEMTTPFVQTALYTLINTRLMSNKKTVISSNLSMDDVRRRYSSQIASRLEGEYRALPFFGDDIRLLRKRRL